MNIISRIQMLEITIKEHRCIMHVNISQQEDQV